MGRIQKLTVANYRSIKGPTSFRFPGRVPVVLVGENNAGKSNLVRSLELLLGESWPGNHVPEDHEFFQRSKENSPILITADVNGVEDSNRGLPVSNISWVFNPDDGPSYRTMLETGDVRFVSNEVRQQCLCLVISADRRLSYQLSYTNRFTLLSRLMKHFHERLMHDDGRAQRLRDIFENLKATFMEVDEFSNFIRELSEQLNQLSGNLRYGLDINMSAYNPSNYFRSLRVQPQEDGQTREYEELGTGQEQILALSFVYAYAKAFHDSSNLILVIEEPESNLHPLAQRWLSKNIRKLSNDGVQVLITTHSPAFLSVDGLEGLVVVTKALEGTEAVQLTRFELAEYCKQAGAERASPETILPFYAAAATDEILSGFFARRIVLVEGPTESSALPAYLAQVGLPPEREGIAVISVEGVGNLAKWFRLFTAYGIPTYVIFDNDADQDDPQAIKRRDVLTTLGVPAAEQGAVIENSDWLVMSKYAVFGQNFEQTMRGLFGTVYAELEAKARSDYSLSSEQSKPLVARYVSDNLSLADFAEAKTKFLALSHAISSVASE